MRLCQFLRPLFARVDVLSECLCLAGKISSSKERRRVGLRAAVFLVERSLDVRCQRARIRVEKIDGGLPEFVRERESDCAKLRSGCLRTLAHLPRGVPITYRRFHAYWGEGSSRLAVDAILLLFAQCLFDGWVLAGLLPRKASGRGVGVALLGRDLRRVVVGRRDLWFAGRRVVTDLLWCA